MRLVVEAQELGEQRLRDVEVADGLASLLHSPGRHVERLVCLLVETVRQVVLQADVARMLPEQLYSHLLASVVVLLFVVGLAQIHCDFEVVWLVLQC